MNTEQIRVVYVGPDVVNDDSVVLSMTRGSLSSDQLFIPDVVWHCNFDDDIRCELYIKNDCWVLESVYDRIADFIRCQG